MRNKQLPPDLKAPSNERFDIKRDIAIEKAGGIFCQACLTGRTDLSPDERYCMRCFSFLTEEGKLLQMTRPGATPGWLPQGSTSPQPLSTALPMAGHNCAPTVSMVPDKPLIMSTSKRGPKHMVLPEDLIVKLAGEGKSPKDIAAILADRGVLVVSSRTIKRLLKRGKP